MLLITLLCFFLKGQFEQKLKSKVKTAAKSKPAAGTRTSAAPTAPVSFI